MQWRITRGLLAAFLLSGSVVQAADFTIDPAHSFVRFKIQHLGYSWMWGGFNGLKGDFSYDAANPGDARIDLTVQTASVDTNHAERDKHLRSGDFLDVQKYPSATFKAARIPCMARALHRSHAAMDAKGAGARLPMVQHSITTPAASATIPSALCHSREVLYQGW